MYINSVLYRVKSVKFSFRMYEDIKQRESPCSLVADFISTLRKVKMFDRQSHKWHQENEDGKNLTKRI